MDIDKIIKDRLYDLEQSPDSGLWAQISEQMTKPENTKKAMIWYI